MTFRFKGLGKLERMDTKTLNNFATRTSEEFQWGNRRMSFGGGHRRVQRGLNSKVD